MSKEYLEALNKIQHDFGQLKGQELVSCYETIFNALNRLESIDNANPSEALECLERIDNTLCLNNIKGKLDFGIDTEEHTDCDSVIGMVEDLETIKEALLKAQEPKHYLKWEDLEFGVPESLPTTMKVKMGDTQYRLSLRISFSDVKSVVLRDTNLKPILHIYEKEKQLFNDLHLERVKEE